MKDKKLDKKFIEVTADGKREIEYGKEPLNKQPEGQTGKPFPLDAAQSNYQDAQNEEKRKKKKMEKKDQLKGGLADKSKSSDFDKKQLEIGTKHEMEHTKDKAIAREIAMDHLKEDANYYTKLKGMEKSTLDRWSLIKKDLKHSDAFMDMLEDDEDEEEEDEETEQAPQEEPQEETGDDHDITDEEHGHLNELLGGEDDSEETGETPPEQEGSEEIPEDVVEAAGGEEEAEELSDEDLADLMKQLGHSEQEIAYILHGHAPPATDPADQAKLQQTQEAHQMDMQGKSQEQKIKLHESGLTSGNAQKLNDLDVDHKKKMNDLEYEMTRKEKELELEHKKKQLELECKHAEDEGDHKSRQRELEYRHSESESDNKLHNSKKEDAVKRKHKEEQHQKKLKECAEILRRRPLPIPYWDMKLPMILADGMLSIIYNSAVGSMELEWRAIWCQTIPVLIHTG